MLIENLRRTARYAGRIGLIVSTMALTSCAESKPQTTLSPVATTSTGQEFTPGQDDVDLFYPEIRRIGLPITSENKVVARSKVPTTIYNFSSFQYNPEAGAAVYNYLEKLADAPEGKVYDYKINGNMRRIRAVFNQIARRSMVIIPGNTQNPSWRKSEGFAFTKIDPEKKIAFSVVKTEDFRDKSISPQIQATLGFTIEACQQSIRTMVINDKDRDTTREEAHFTQEIICNSLGAALATRLYGMPYEQYRRNGMRTSIELPLGSGNKYPFIILSSQEYNLIPTAGLILK